MKKTLLFFALLSVLGFGCTKEEIVRGAWKLAFTLPDNWIMISAYTNDENRPLETRISRHDGVVALQSQQKKFCMNDPKDCPEDTVSLPDGESVIVAAALAPEAEIPATAEDMGNGFSRVMRCEDGGACTLNHRGSYEYYLKTTGGRYEFSYWGDRASAESIILTAKEVNKYTDFESLSE